MSYRLNCKWFQQLIKNSICLRRKFTMDGCDPDCPLYEKK